jgi:hypothetical protein
VARAPADRVEFPRRARCWLPASARCATSWCSTRTSARTTSASSRPAGHDGSPSHRRDHRTGRRHRPACPGHRRPDGSALHRVPADQSAACSARLDEFFTQWFDTVYTPGGGATGPSSVDRVLPGRASTTRTGPAAGLGADWLRRHGYSSWRRKKLIGASGARSSLRPRGARSSHWYMPQSPSSPRA